MNNTHPPISPEAIHSGRKTSSIGGVEWLIHVYRKMASGTSSKTLAHNRSARNDFSHSLLLIEAIYCEVRMAFTLVEDYIMAYCLTLVSQNLNHECFDHHRSCKVDLI